MNPSNVEIRQFILDTFSESEFVDLFCSDYFPQAKNDFSADWSFALNAQKLIEYCQHRGVMDNLLADLQKERSELYVHRFLADPHPPQDALPTAQATIRNPRQVFISYAHQDADFAHRLASDMKQRGWVPWITPESIRPGEKWVAAIGRGLDENCCVHTSISPSSTTMAQVGHS